MALDEAVQEHALLLASGRATWTLGVPQSLPSGFFNGCPATEINHLYEVSLLWISMLPASVVSAEVL